MVSINLLPENKTQAYQLARDHAKIFLIGLVALLMTMLLLKQVLSASIAEQQKHKTQLQTAMLGYANTLSEVQLLGEQQVELHGQLRTYQETYQRQEKALQILYCLVSHLPETMHFTQLSVTDENWKIDGYAIEEAPVYHWFEALNQQMFSAQLKKLHQVSAQQYSFTVVLAHG